LFTREINVKEETFRISSSSTSREDHEARHKSRHEVKKTPNNSRAEASTRKTLGDILAAQDSMIFRYRFRDLNDL
jgi:hypothetical protein